MVQRLPGQDMALYAQLIRNSFATVAAEFGLTPQNCPQHTSFITGERLEERYRQGYRFYGSRIGGALVAFAALADLGEGLFELDHLAVLPAHRHRGLGTELVRFCGEEARRSGGRELRIGIIEENQRLKNWYLNQGFLHQGTARFPHLPFTVGFLALDLSALPTA